MSAIRVVRSRWSEAASLSANSGPELRASVATQQANHLNCPRNSVAAYVHSRLGFLAPRLRSGMPAALCFGGDITSLFGRRASKRPLGLRRLRRASDW